MSEHQIIVDEDTTTSEDPGQEVPPAPVPAGPVEMVIIDGKRYRPDELPDQLVRAGLIPDYDRPGFNVEHDRSEEDLAWNPVRGPRRSYALQTGGPEVPVAPYARQTRI